jgi:hypothetical protein
MAEYGEWNQKGTTLSEVTAQSEYDVTREFIIKGIKTGNLEYRDGAIWRNPYLRVLRSQVEAYIVGELGAEFLNKNKNQTELRKIKTEINILNKKLKALQVRKNELELSLEKANNAEQTVIAAKPSQHLSLKNEG